jgi:hypothetical protein
VCHRLRFWEVGSLLTRLKIEQTNDTNRSGKYANVIRDRRGSQRILGGVTRNDTATHSHAAAVSKGGLVQIRIRAASRGRASERHLEQHDADQKRERDLSKHPQSLASNLSKSSRGPARSGLSGKAPGS